MGVMDGYIWWVDMVVNGFVFDGFWMIDGLMVKIDAYQWFK